MILRNKFYRFIKGDSDLKEIIRGSSVSFLFKMFGMAIGYIFSFIVARSLGADTWGIFSLCLSLITIGSIIGVMGMDTGILRLLPEYRVKNSRVLPDIYRKTFLLVFFISLVISVAIYKYSHIIAEGVFHKNELVYYFKISSFAILPMSLIKLNVQSLRGLKKITQYAFFDFVSRWLFPTIIFVIIYTFIKASPIVLISYIISLYIILIISLIFTSKNLEFKTNSNRISYTQIVSLSLPLMLASSLMFFKGWIDKIMLGIFMTTADVGIYDISLKLATLVTLSLTAVNVVAAPKFAEAYGKNDITYLEKIVKKSTKLIFFISFPIMLMLILIPKILLGLFGENFKSGTYSLLILSAGYFVNVLAGSVGYFVQMTGRQIAYQNITFVTVIVGLVLNLLLIPRFGINGAALSTSIGLVVWNLLLVFYVKKETGIVTIYIPYLSQLFR